MLRLIIGLLAIIYAVSATAEHNNHLENYGHSEKHDKKSFGPINVDPSFDGSILPFSGQGVTHFGNHGIVPFVIALIPASYLNQLLYQQYPLTGVNNGVIGTGFDHGFTGTGLNNGFTGTTLDNGYSGTGYNQVVGSTNDGFLSRHGKNVKK